jgi:uncharacterized protein YegP (UPF0339 family)
VSAKFTIVEDAGRYRFALLADGGRVVATSEPYPSRAWALRGAAWARRSAASAVLEQAAPGPASAPAAGAGAPRAPRPRTRPAGKAATAAAHRAAAVRAGLLKPGSRDALLPPLPAGPLTPTPAVPKAAANPAPVACGVTQLPRDSEDRAGARSH